MKVSFSWKAVAIIGTSLVLIAGTNAAQYFAIWKPHESKVVKKYNVEISTLRNTVKALGPMTGVWAIKAGDTNIYAGKEVTQEDLSMREVPSSAVSPDAITKSSQAIGKYFKISLQPGTILSSDLLMKSQISNSDRLVDVVASVLPVGLKVGNYVDLRIVYPLGGDYVVLSHKRIEAINSKTVKMNLDETELLRYDGALVDYFLQKTKGAYLYMSEYVDPGSQKPAEVFYAVPKNIEAVMKADPNIVDKAKSSINSSIRQMIDSGTSGISDNIGSEITSGRDGITSAITSGQTSYKSAEKQSQSQTSTQSNPLNSTIPTSPKKSTSKSTLNVGKGVVN